MEPLKRKYGLFTAIAMVVGIVIGSGVFFKAEKVLKITGGNLPLAILAWLLGGLIMIICAYTFALMATKYGKINGIMDYAEANNGKGYGYCIGWFTTTIYYPCIASVIAWLCARYTGVLFGFGIASPEVMTLASLFLVGSFTLNSLSPILAGKFQITTTFIKLIPLVLTAIVGTIIGLVRGVTVQNFSTVVTEVNKTSALFSAVCATAFAYDGWIIATSINAELKNPKKDLPKALILGSIIVIIVYLLYNIGLAGGITNKQMIDYGASGANESFKSIFGNFAGTALTVFVVISCMGTLNGAMLGCTRGMYSIAVRNLGPHPDLYKQIDTKTNMPTSSAVLGLFLCAFWLLVFYGGNLAKPHWFGMFSFDSSELPIITLYAMYIPIFIMMMVKEKDLHWFKRFVMPTLSILGCILMVVASVIAHGKSTLYYLIIYAIIMALGIAIYIFQTKKKSKNK